MGSIVSVASAPGKIMLAGEYAVLDGHPCMVAAVSRRARVTLRSDGSAGSGTGSPEIAPDRPEARLTLSIAAGRLGLSMDLRDPIATGNLIVDVGKLRSVDGARKLGLGSSAACAAATAAAAFEYAGRSLERRSTMDDVFECALLGHRAVSPKGSGADVAAATFGRTLRFTPTTKEGALPDVRVMDLPQNVHLRVVWTGAEARTDRFVEQVRSKRHDAGYDKTMSTIVDATVSFERACDANDEHALVRAIDAHHEAMAKLGDFAGVPVVESNLALVNHLARECGGASKPAGAGGGDVAVAAFVNENDCNNFERVCENKGLAVLGLQIGAEGARQETIHE